MTTFTAKVTNQGLALYTAAVASGIPVNLVSMLIGDGNGSPTTPNPAQTTLVHQVYDQLLSNVTIDGSDPTIMYPEAALDAATGGWTIREIGLKTDGGILFAVANFPTTEKPVIANGSTRELVIRFGLQLANTSAVNIVIDPAVVMATEAWVLDQITSDHGSSTTVNTTGGTTVLNATQYGKQFIVVTGVLASNATLQFPTQKGQWKVINNTTGAYTLTCKTLAGSGVTVTQGKSDSILCNGVDVIYGQYDVTLRPVGDSSSAAASTLYVDRAVGQVGGYYQDTGGVANAYVVALSPVLTAYDHVVSFRFRTTRANSGACTLDAGAGAINLKTEGGAALQLGDVPTGSIVSVTIDPAIGYAVINELVPSQLGALASMGIGAGLTNDGSGNLTLNGVGNYPIDTGTANAYVIALTPVIASYVGKNGLTVKFRATHANSAGCTLNAGGGVISLLRDDGTALQSGDIPNNALIEATYDTNANAFLLKSVVQSQLGTLAHLGIGAGLTNDGSGNLTLNGVGNYPIDTGAANAYVIALTPVIASYAGENGLTVKFRATHANTTGCTLNAGGGVISLLRDDGTALQSGDIPNNALIEATYDTNANAFLLKSVVQSQLGTLAHLGIGANLYIDGSNNLAATDQTASILYQLGLAY